MERAWKIRSPFLVNHDRFSPVSIDQIYALAGCGGSNHYGQTIPRKTRTAKKRGGCKVLGGQERNLHHAISETAATYMTDVIDRYYPAVETSGMFFELSNLRRHLMPGTA